MKVEDLIKTLQKLPKDTTIGLITQDDEGDNWASEDIHIHKQSKANVKYGHKNLDYYLL